ncbi:Sec-independent protein translocase protein TatB [Ensifer sp.]|uniref:Sec-independent protein translocase protein TatB n=1 Tax=Ensifer sp. TaxID=1872086 RepID=UPI0028A1A24B|nr:Sec-independent protein translocase protein TatB [Ensifer sp.]
MLDIGWTELVVIAIVLIIVVGPKDLPPMLRAFGRMTSKLRGMASDFRQQFDEALREADLEDVRKTISDAQSLNPANALREAMNPLRQIGDEIKSDLQKAASPDKPAVAASPEPSAVAAVPASAPVAAATEAKPADTVAAAAIGSAGRQMQRAGTPEPVAKLKRTVKAKADAAPAPKKASASKVAPVETVPAKAAKKPAVKKPAKAAVEAPNEKPQKTRATTRKKGDA